MAQYVVDSPRELWSDLEGPSDWTGALRCAIVRRVPSPDSLAFREGLNLGKSLWKPGLSRCAIAVAGGSTDETREDTSREGA
jgi:hypothetical protein